MQSEIEKYGCKKCWVYQLDHFQDLYNNSYKCVSCKYTYAVQELKEAFKTHQLYRFMIWVLDGLSWVLSGFGRRQY